MIICLGESIVAIGLAANGNLVDPGLLAAVGFALLATIGLWRTYFGPLTVNAEQRLRQTDGDVVLAAADGYSYLHLLIVAGIVVFATGVRVAIDDPTAPLPDAVRLCLCGGIALYLLGHAAFAYGWLVRSTAPSSWPQRGRWSSTSSAAALPLGSASRSWPRSCWR